MNAKNKRKLAVEITHMSDLMNAEKISSNSPGVKLYKEKVLVKVTKKDHGYGYLLSAGTVKSPNLLARSGDAQNKSYGGKAFDIFKRKHIHLDCMRNLHESSDCDLAIAFKKAQEIDANAIIVKRGVRVPLEIMAGN